MKRFTTFHAAICMLLLAISLPIQTATAQAKKPTKTTIGIQATQINDAIKETASKNGSSKYLTLKRISQSMDQQLIDRFHNTRKFNIVSRADLKTILKDQELQEVFTDPSDAKTAQAFKIAGCQYSLIVTIDDYQDMKEQLRGDGGQILATKRTFRLSAISKLYDNATGLLRETSNIQVTNTEGAQKLDGAYADAELSDRLITILARELAHKSANRVMDVLYPAKIIGLTGKMATLNRGDGTGIAKDQVWTIYATGEEMIDPDTGESLGAEEIPVGKMKIAQVTPKFSRGTIIEDFGVAKLHVARLDESKATKN
ncbi:CsgG/HfaB family protein [Poriferisphaera sp. WC338]|uniref:CsgG/HfaB family protein n=1 Tax=Poriferisphaera sp. WC338 TaxID=3425129 RepID=UPI003D81A501